MKKILNLKRDFDPLDTPFYERINFELIHFPGGEPHIKIDPEIRYDPDFLQADEVVITTRIEDGDDLADLMVANDALDRMLTGHTKSLFLPYIPGGRQDRLANDGEAFTAKVYADVINRMYFDTVYTLDTHSEVTHALWNNLISFTNLFIISKLNTEGLLPNGALVIPDAGAAKKSFAIQQEFDNLFPTAIQCLKHRDTQTGKLSSFQILSPNLHKMPCVIVDDICDGGGTFIGLAEKLKEKDAGELTLIVSHGIFSKGIEELLKIFDRIYTTDSRSEPERESYENPRLQVVKINELKLPL